jgi:hypothetical protein
MLEVDSKVHYLAKRSTWDLSCCYGLGMWRLDGTVGSGFGFETVGHSCLGLRPRQDVAASGVDIVAALGDIAALGGIAALRCIVHWEWILFFLHRRRILLDLRWVWILCRCVGAEADCSAAYSSCAVGAALPPPVGA